MTYLKSFILISYLTTILVAVDNEKAFSFGTDFRTFYYNGLRDNRQDREALAVGGIFKLETNSFYGLRGAAAFYASHDLLRRGSGSVERINNGTVVTDTSDIGGNSELIQSDGSSIDSLAEAYLEYHLGNSTLRIGRQRISSPLVNDFYNRFLPNSFEAILLTNQDIPKTTLTVAVIDRWKYKAAEDFQGIAEGIGLNENLYMFGVVNQSINQLKIEGWFYRLTNAFDSYFTAVSYKKVSLFQSDWKIDAVIHYLKQNATGDKMIGDLNTYLLGAKGSLSTGNFSFSLMIDQVGDDTIRGSGNEYANMGWSSFINYTDIQIDGEALNAGALSYGTGIEYQFTPTYKAAFKYVHIDQDDVKQLASITPNKRPSSNEYNIDMTYYNKEFGNLRLRLAQIDYAVNPIITNEYDEINIRLIYDYRFVIN